MTTLDKVIEMQQQGLPDAEIINRLTNEGTSPKEINDSLNQARVKNAVSAETTANNQQQGPGTIPGMNEAPQSIPPQNDQMTNNLPGQSTPQTQMPLQGEQMPLQDGQNFNPDMQPPMASDPGQMASQMPGPEVYPPESPSGDYQNYYPETPQAYGQDYYGESYDSGGYADTEVISEVAEQVASEKINEFKQNVGDIASFKATMQDKISDIDERLKRIENSIDSLQHAIINKVGEFGESSNLVHKDLGNLHETVSKLMNPLMDNYNELKKLNKK